MEEKVGIKLKEFNKYLDLLLRIVPDIFYKTELRLLLQRIRRLVKKSGGNFTFLYLKECVRLTVRVMADAPETKSPGRGLLVRRDSRGFPSIIPLFIRNNLVINSSNNSGLFKIVLSLLSIYRVFPTKPVPSLGTIIKPFKGSCRTLPVGRIKPALKELIGDKKFDSSMSYKLIFRNSVGPNHTLGSFGASYDALAFIFQPLAFYNGAKIVNITGGTFYIFGVVSIILLALPLYSVLYLLGIEPVYKIGKLSVVYDQAGKARIIGIISYGYQLCLKPLHDLLYSLLRKIDTDGTFDQLRPLEKLLEDESDECFFSFDLSAATDRLPIDLQRDILNQMFSCGTYGEYGFRLFKSILGSGKGESVEYSVGQPMGAYSSWAMLAFSHHVIIRIAAHRVGKSFFTKYAVLGDDVVIKDEMVAYEYAAIMDELGVNINSYKTLVSEKVLEFAKVGRSKECDYTPIGPGIVLRAIRYSYFTPIYFVEAYRLKLIESLPQLLEIILDSSSKNPLLPLWATLGLTSPFVKDQWYAFANRGKILSRTDLPCTLSSFYRTLHGSMERDYEKDKENLDKDFDHFVEKGLEVSYVKNPLLYEPKRLLEHLFKLIGPTGSIYMDAFHNAFLYYESEEYLSKLKENYEDFLTYDSEAKKTEVARKLIKLSPSLNFESLELKSKQDIKTFGHATRNLLKEAEINGKKDCYIPGLEDDMEEMIRNLSSSFGY